MIPRFLGDQTLVFQMLLVGTLPETNIAPENGWLEYHFPIGMAYFQGLLPLVSGRVNLRDFIILVCSLGW